MVRGLAEDAHVTVFVEQPHLTIIGNVAPNEVTAAAIPGAALGPQRSRPESLNGRVANFVFGEAGIKHHDVRIRVTHDGASVPISISSSHVRRQYRPSRRGRPDCEK